MLPAGLHGFLERSPVLAVLSRNIGMAGGARCSQPHLPTLHNRLRLVPGIRQPGVHVFACRVLQCPVHGIEGVVIPPGNDLEQMDQRLDGLPVAPHLAEGRDEEATPPSSGLGRFTGMTQIEVLQRNSNRPTLRWRDRAFWDILICLKPNRARMD